MTPRERVLAMIVLALLLFGGGGVGAYMLILTPLQEKKQAADNLQKEVDDLEFKLRGMQKTAPQVAAVKRASLPPDALPDPKDTKATPTYNFAVAEYKRLIQDLLLRAGIKDGRPTSEKVSAAGRPPVTPEIGPKKPAYTTLTFRVEMNKVNLWQVIDFLYGYYQVDLLHQITDIEITREGKLTDDRAGLKVVITSEAIALDGVPPRSSLFTGPTAVAAVAGIPAFHAVSTRPELVQKLMHPGSLAVPPRDYSYIVLNDMFYGAVPPYTPRPLTLGRLSDVVMKRDDQSKEVKIPLTGEGASGARIKATASGKLLPEGSLEVDPRTGTIHLPAIKSDAPESATSTVSIEVVTADKSTIKTGNFTVAVEPLPKPPPGPDIAGAIRLVIVSTSSDGTAEAVIKDNANPFRYEIEATASGIKVSKWWQAKNWRKDLTYDQPPGVLQIADEETSTRRTLKVIAIEHNALIVCERPKLDVSKLENQKPGTRLTSGSARQGRAEPVSAVAGAITAAIPEPVYYRWTGGKSLKELLDPSTKNPNRLKPEEVHEILRRVASEGPVGKVVASSRD